MSQILFNINYKILIFDYLILSIKLMSFPNIKNFLKFVIFYYYVESILILIIYKMTSDKNV